jgi:hypothetical protein
LLSWVGKREILWRLNQVRGSRLRILTTEHPSATTALTPIEFFPLISFNSQITSILLSLEASSYCRPGIFRVDFCHEYRGSAAGREGGLWVGYKMLDLIAAGRFGNGCSLRGACGRIRHSAPFFSHTCLSISAISFHPRLILKLTFRQRFL